MANTKIPVELSSTPSIVDNGNATAITIDSSERVGIGTASPSSILHLSTSNDPKITLTDTGFGASADITGSNGNLRLNSQTATIFDMADSEIARFDSSGRFGIGTDTIDEKLHIQGSVNNDDIAIKIENNYDDNLSSSRPSAALTFTAASNNGHLRVFGAPANTAANHQIDLGSTAGSSFLTFSPSNSEAMRIDSSGRLLLNTTSGVVFNDAKHQIECDSTGWGIGIDVNQTSAAHGAIGVSINSSSDSPRVLRVDRNGTIIGSITQTSSSVSYNTSSDGRLKDVTGEARGLEVINELKPVAYNWKESGQSDEGLIAQEVMEIVPNAVTGSEEDIYQMDYSKLVTPLIKAVQELSNEVNELKQEIQNLKGE